MPRRPRLAAAGIPMHITQRGHNRSETFLDAFDRAAYLGFLLEASQRERCAVHAYVLMSNHTHLLVTPSTATAASRMMQHLGRRYVWSFNQRHRRSGTLWEGRFHSSIIDSSAYLLACSRYIDLNPVRAFIVPTPNEYEWSSYACLALGRPDGLVTPHPEYLALGTSPAARQREYRRLCGVMHGLRANPVIHRATARREVLGSSEFTRVMSVALQRPDILRATSRLRDRHCSHDVTQSAPMEARTRNGSPVHDEEPAPGLASKPLTHNGLGGRRHRRTPA